MRLTSPHCSFVSGSPIVARTTRTPCGANPRVSSSAYVQTPPMVSAVMRIVEGRLMKSWLSGVAVNGVERLGHLDDACDLRVEAAAGGEPLGPINGGSAAPIVGRIGEPLAGGA